MPGALRECATRPEPPAEGSTQRDVALYILDLVDAHGDCRTKHGALLDAVEGGR